MTAVLLVPRLCSGFNNATWSKCAWNFHLLHIQVSTSRIKFFFLGCIFNGTSPNTWNQKNFLDSEAFFIHWQSEIFGRNWFSLLFCLLNQHICTCSVNNQKWSAAHQERGLLSQLVGFFSPPLKSLLKGFWPLAQESCPKMPDVLHSQVLQCKQCSVPWEQGGPSPIFLRGGKKNLPTLKRAQ